jgi:RNA polymerase sigma-70 factor (ECF subfamily)
MSQRLVRAKTKIRDAGIPFRVPDLPEITERLSFVLDAIYAAYTTGWDSLPDAASTHRALASEAIALGRVLVQLMPAEPEALGLLALMLHCDARREARFSSTGKFIPLDQQDTTRWLRNLMEEAEKLLRTAAGFGQSGRYQLEVQSNPFTRLAPNPGSSTGGK